MPLTADRCKETSTTTGTGAMALLGAVSQYQSFATAFPLAPLLVQYAIVGQTGTEWEVGFGTFTAPSTLARDGKVRSSSNGNALVNFSVGTKDVFATASAELIDNANTGVASVRVKGWAMM